MAKTAEKMLLERQMMKIFDDHIQSKTLCTWARENREFSVYADRKKCNFFQFQSGIFPFHLDYIVDNIYTRSAIAVSYSSQ